jgi:hypothetical protein
MLNHPKRRTEALARRIKELHPAYNISFVGECAIIVGEDSPDLLIKELNELVREHFEGKIKEVEVVVADEFRYISFRAIPETAIVR